MWRSQLNLKLYNIARPAHLLHGDGYTSMSSLFMDMPPAPWVKQSTTEVSDSELRR